MNNFEEDIYLALNPDVEEAVFSGQCLSGKQHYQEQGKFEGRISSVEEYLDYQANKIKGLEHDLLNSKKEFDVFNAEKNQVISDLTKEISAIHNTISWKITYPLRRVLMTFKQIKFFLASLIAIFRSYKIRKIIIFIPKIFTRNGIERTKNVIKEFNKKLSKSCLDYDRVISLNDVPEGKFKITKDLAVHVHIYYPRLITEILYYLDNIPIPFVLYVSVVSSDTEQIAWQKLKKIKNLKKLNIQVVENRGRDIAPMLVAFGRSLSSHDVALHIHTKQSPHNPWILNGWRRYLMEMLLGTPDRIVAVLEQFSKDPQMGFLFPKTFFPIRGFIENYDEANDRNIEKLLRMHGCGVEKLEEMDRKFFPAGNMFWFRGAAIKPFIKMGLSNDHFEIEDNQTDGTLAHAIERSLPFFVSEQKYVAKSFEAYSFENQYSSAHKVNLLNSYISRGIVKNEVVIIFDHDLGGGTNTYSRELVEKCILNNQDVFRIYFKNNSWFLKWYGNGDGMIFYLESDDDLLSFLARGYASKIIINSLYGIIDHGPLIEKIINLKSKSDLFLELLVHDFLMVCPSPHLLDVDGKYCGIPSTQTCAKCIGSLNQWYPSWIPDNSRAKHIESWRLPFEKLINAADKIIFFDLSGVDILSRAFTFDRTKVEVVPHQSSHINFSETIDLNGPIKIGILGTLSEPKGIRRVKELASFIESNNLSAKVVVVGTADLKKSKSIAIHGAYEVKDLPLIIKQYCVNVIFCPSIIPETFGYTLSEAMALKMPIVCFDIGAQSNRVGQYKYGKVIALSASPNEVLDSLKCALSNAIGKK
jgi:glycosyltransferase involved in cell wall biosynthesis